jgi:hypothetical protein
MVITFREPVSNFDLADLLLQRGGGVNLLGTGQTLTTSDQVTFVLGNLNALTSTSGTYTLTLAAAGANIRDLSGTLMEVNATSTFVVDVLAPVADVVDITPDPFGATLGSATLSFNEPVSGLTLANLSLSRNGGPDLLTATQTLTTTDNRTWTLGNLTALTSSDGQYALSLTPTDVHDLAIA